MSTYRLGRGHHLVPPPFKNRENRMNASKPRLEDYHVSLSYIRGMLDQAIAEGWSPDDFRVGLAQCLPGQMLREAVDAGAMKAIQRDLLGLSEDRPSPSPRLSIRYVPNGAEPDFPDDIFVPAAARVAASVPAGLTLLQAEQVLAEARRVLLSYAVIQPAEQE